jgi:hypothetical protein
MADINHLHHCYLPPTAAVTFDLWRAIEAGSQLDIEGVSGARFGKKLADINHLHHCFPPDPLEKF